MDIGPLPQALRIHGAKAKVAVGLNISTAAVSQWRQVPESRHVAVAEILQVKPEELRPDLYLATAP